jgi:hypothetical protein
MTQDDLPVARNTCPLCDKPTHIPLLQFLPSRWGKGFRCSSCDERICVARSTQQVAYLGGLLALGATLGAAYVFASAMQRIGLLPRQGSPLWPLVSVFELFGALGASLALPLFAAPFGRLTLRLEPWVNDTI